MRGAENVPEHTEKGLETQENYEYNIIHFYYPCINIYFKLGKQYELSDERFG